MTEVIACFKVILDENTFVYSEIRGLSSKIAFISATHEQHEKYINLVIEYLAKQDLKVVNYKHESGAPLYEVSWNEFFELRDNMNKYTMEKMI